MPAPHFLISGDTWRVDDNVAGATHDEVAHHEAGHAVVAASYGGGTCTAAGSPDSLASRRDTRMHTAASLRLSNGSLCAWVEVQARLDFAGILRHSRLAVSMSGLRRARSRTASALVIQNRWSAAAGSMLEADWPVANKRGGSSQKNCSAWARSIGADAANSLRYRSRLGSKPNWGEH